MLVLKVETEVPLTEPNEDFGFVTRLAITVREFEAPIATSVGTAEVLLINCAEALNRGVAIFEVLDADSEELEELYEVFFDDGELKERFRGGMGTDILYVQTLEVDAAWQGRRIEEAIVRKVLDVWGSGCAIGVMQFASSDEEARWTAMGFSRVDDGGALQSGARYGYIDLSLRQPVVVEADDDPHTFHVAEAPQPDLPTFEDDDEDDEDDEDEDVQDDDRLA